MLDLHECKRMVPELREDPMATRPGVLTVPVDVFCDVPTDMRGQHHGPHFFTRAHYPNERP
jgi:hypothetical protein